MRVRSEDELFDDDFTPVADRVLDQPERPLSSSRNDAPPVDPHSGGGRGRGSGRGEPRGNGLSRKGTKTAFATPGSHEVTATGPSTKTSASESTPAGPREEPPISVRGSRQATGGVRKPKLTEEQLTERMAAIQIKNANLTAAHARAEADAASFAQREEEAKFASARKQKTERRDRQQMMGERERNRLRKLKAAEGREWDAEKQEDDYRSGGRFDKEGGFAGDDKSYTNGSEYLYRESNRKPHVVKGTSPGQGMPKARARPKADDFPALPGATQGSGGDPLAGASGITSWADQVE